MNPHIDHKSDPQVGHFGKIRNVNSLLLAPEEEHKWKGMVIFSLSASKRAKKIHLLRIFHENLDT